jgi:hypothetical protein
MVKYFWLPLLLLVFLAGCAKDVVLGGDTELVGVYNAYFYYTEDFGSSTAKTTKVKVIWNFISDKAFNYTVDNDDAFTDADHSICDVSTGAYTHETLNEMVFSDAIAGVGSVCDDNTLVDGEFNYKTVEDTIEIDRYIPEEALKFVVKLVKITE